MPKSSTEAYFANKAYLADMRHLILSEMCCRPYHAVCYQFQKLSAKQDLTVPHVKVYFQVFQQHAI